MGPRIALNWLNLLLPINLAVGRKNEKKETPTLRRHKLFLSPSSAASEQVHARPHRSSSNSFTWSPAGFHANG